MKRLITMAAMALLTACQSGEVDARQDKPSQKGVAEPRTAIKGTSTASWEGKSSGQLRFDNAACMVMNGEIINFYAPAKAMDSIGEEVVLPQINGSKAGKGWAINVMAAQGITHSGSGEANAETPRALDVTAKLLDGASAGRGSVDTVAATIRIECTDIDDLGTTRRSGEQALAITAVRPCRTGYEPQLNNPQEKSSLCPEMTSPMLSLLPTT